MTKFDLLPEPETPRDYAERFLAHTYLIVLAAFTFGPYILMLLISLMGNGWSPTQPPKSIPVNWSLINFQELFTEFQFGQYLLNTFIVAGGTTLSVLVFDSLSGYAFARLEFWGRDVTFVAVLATLMISPMVLIIPVYILFSQFGLVNSYVGIILPHAVTGFGVFLMRQFIKTLPSSLEDAALIDGCSKFDIYWRIVLPMMKPALVTLGLITFITTWNSFLWPLVLARDQSLYTLTVALGFFQGQLYTDWSGLMAATTLTMLPVVVLFVAMQDQYVRGFRIGGMKGD
jgi:ABC-type glycerol-3-phosphate transport system permease component